MISLKNSIKERLAGKIINWQEHSARRIYISIKPKDLKEAVSFLFKECKTRFATASAVDTPQGIEILYHFSFDKAGEIFSLRVLIENKEKPQIDSIAGIFVAAEWIEREIWEMLGVNFIGHPNLKRLLLSEEWPQDKYPLRHEHES